MRYHTACLCAAFSALASCGGGDSSPPVVVQPLAAQTPANAQRMEPSVSVDPTSIAAANVEIIGPRGDPDRIRITVDGQTFDYDATGTDSISGSGSWERFVKGDSSSEGLVDTRSQHVTNFRLRSEQDWGTPYGGGILAVGADGTLTPLDAIPTNGSATYTGNSIGYLLVGTVTGSNLYTTRSDVALDANFAAGDIGFLASNSVIARPGTPTASFSALDAQAALQVVDGRFQGNLTTPGTTNVIGTIDGNFYGPNAENVGGTMDYGFRLGGRTTSYTGISSFSAN